MSLYFSQSHTCITFIEKNYCISSKLTKMSCKNMTGNCFSYKLRSDVQLISDSMIVGFELYVYDVKVNFKLKTKFIYDM